MLSALGLVVAASPALADPLRTVAAARGLIIGAAVDTNPLANEAAYRTTLNREFNGVTPENAMKWDTTEPNPGQFNFAGADQVVNSATANGQVIHGHTMVWHQQTPGWVQGLGAAQMRTALQNHMNMEMGRYAGKIESWDVVNEAFNDDGTRRASFWQNTLGANYIADAFRMARTADPTAKLCYNDFNIEGVNAKSNAVFSLLSSFKQQGVPIDCLGIQGHLSIDFSFPGQVQQNIQRFADLGLDVKFTELDVRMTLPTSAAKLSTQATYYTNVVNACKAVTRCNQITIWGFTDKFSWVPGTFSGQGAALPFDENYNPKPAYNAINTALGGVPTNDTTPPTQPGTPTASGVTANSAALAWTASTDTGGSGLAGYNVYQRQGTTDTLLSQSTSNSTTLTGLTASTQFVVVVRARDGAGNLSTPSAAVTFTTQAGGGGTGPCQVTYGASNWGGGGGFTANVTLVNTGTAAINGWTLAFTFTGGQRVTLPGWSATWAQAAGSANVTATNLDWNRTLAPNGSTSFGFNGTFTGTSNPAPTAFTVNGTACTIG
ncbi:MAG: endo-1,4-beta-xylanase [Labedaea sp.]